MSDYMGYVSYLADKTERRYARKSGPDIIYTYLIICRGFMKIGVSRNPERRLMAITTATPFPVALVGYIYGGQEVEREIHQKLSHLHHSGEWFRRSISFVDAFRFNSIRPAVSTIDRAGNRNVGSVTKSRHTELVDGSYIDDKIDEFLL